MASKSSLSVVIDIGTSKIVALAGERNELGKLEIRGISKVLSKGIRRGVVYNIEEAANCIEQVLTRLESQLDKEIVKVNVAYAGQHMKTIDYQDSRFTSEEGVVSKFDIDHLYNEAKRVELEQHYEIVQVIPTYYEIDGEVIEQNPVGITGREIIANYKLVIISDEYLANLHRVFDRVGIEMGEITLSSLASAEAVLTEEEKEMGAIVLDIGAGTTNLAIFHDSRLIHAAVIPFGGNVVTKDIKEGCSILLKWAEQLKVQYGHALGDFADDQKVVTIPGHNGWEPKEISFRSLAFIIQARLEEIMDSVNAEIEKSEIVDQLGAGIVITGGTSNLNNFKSLVKFRTGMDARKANLAFNPKGAKEISQDPDNYTAIGLLNLLVNEIAIPERAISKKAKRKENGGLSFIVNKVVQGVLDMVDDDNEDIELN
ncbi:MAG: cell division protein FtsA [Bacteroidetes bacterium]|nr:cell division protein FtsA [Bacteroidota bacterium]